MRNLPAGLILLVALAACGNAADPALRDPAVFKSTEGLSVCAAGSVTKGIDVSEWQGNINWSQVAGGGWMFAFIRVSDGTGHMDPYFSSNWSSAKSAGLLRGAYQFFEPGESASAQAQVVVNAVGHLGSGDLPVMMDVETATPTAAELNTWLAAVESGTGKRPVIYSSSGLWNQWFPNGGFGSYGVDAANWGVSCPSMPAGWSNWVFWQYADNASVSGISGNVDADYYNGSLSALQTYADSDLAPRGAFDSATCDSVDGWSQDQDAPSQAINVDLYFGGAAGSGVPGQRTVAGNSRADLCSAIGSCDHGFSWSTPRGLMDGAAHEIHAYGIDANGSNNAELTNSPKSVTCTQAETGVRRHIASPAVLSAWGFSTFQDLRPVSDATFNGYAQDSDWPATPQLIQGTGDPAVYMVDGVFKRHVISPTSAAEWHLDLGTTQQQPLAQVQAMPSGPDLRERPMLIKATGAAVDLLDDPLPVIEVDAGPPTTTTTTSTSTATSTSTGTTGEATTSTATSTTTGSTATSTTGTTATSTTGDTTTSAGASTTTTAGASTTTTTGAATTTTTTTGAASTTTGTSSGGVTSAGAATGTSGTTSTSGGATSGGCAGIGGGFDWAALLALAGFAVQRRGRRSHVR